MAQRVGSLTILRAQFNQYAETVRSLGPWLIVAVPFWAFIGRRAYAREQERQRLLRLGPVLKRDRRR